MLMSKACIPPKRVEDFVKAIEDGTISLDDLLLAKNSEKRNALLEIHFEDSSNLANAQVEGKLMLKDQKAGLERWLEGQKNVPKKFRDVAVNKINKLEKAMNTKGDSDAFYKDLVDTTMGLDVDAETAQKIFDLASELEGMEQFTQAYGDKRNELQKLMDSNIQESFSLAGEVAQGLSFLTRGLLTTGEFSAFMRQGLRYAGTSEWFKAVASTPRFTVSEGGLDHLRSRMFASKYADKIMPNARALGATAFGKGLSNKEEDVGSKYMRNLPFVGETFNKINPLAAFARAYEGFLTDLRFRRMETVLGKWEKNNPELFNDKEAVTNLAKVISTNTGRGSLGNFELAAGDLGAVAFSARFFASQIQGYTDTMLMGTKFGAKKGGKAEATRGLILHARNTMGVIALGAAMGAEVEDDPLSSDWGKICWGNTCLDATGGSSAILRTIVRLMRGKTKSAREKVVKDLTGKQKGDVIGDFLGNKKSPLLNVMNDYLIRNRDFDFKEISRHSSFERQREYFIDNLLTPMIAGSYMDAKQYDRPDDDIPEWAVSLVGESIGLASSSFERARSNEKPFWDKIDDGENPFVDLTSKSKPKSKSSKRRFRKLQ